MEILINIGHEDEDGPEEEEDDDNDVVKNRDGEESQSKDGGNIGDGLRSIWRGRANFQGCLKEKLASRERTCEERRRNLRDLIEIKRNWILKPIFELAFSILSVRFGLPTRPEPKHDDNWL